MRLRQFKRPPLELNLRVSVYARLVHERGRS